MRPITLMCALAILLAPAAGASQTFPQPANPTEQAILSDVMRATTRESPDLAEVDRLLTQLPAPTPLRGLLQAARAGALQEAGRNSEAIAAVEEAVRIWPDGAIPRITGIYILTFGGMPQRAADYWFELVAIDTELARQGDPYVLNALVGRLDDIGDQVRSSRLLSSMAEIGIVAALVPQRSKAALAKLIEIFERSGVEAARPLVSAVANPDDLVRLSIDNRYRALWPAIETWAGADFVPMHRRYLEELRREWWARQDMEAAVGYARELADVRQNDAIIALFLPLFAPDRLTAYRDGGEFLAPVVANALFRSDRGSEANTLLKRVEGILPADSGSRLNLSAARLSRAGEAGAFAEVVSISDEWLRDAKPLGASINTHARLLVAGRRACALGRLQRPEAAAAAAAITLAEATIPGPAYELYVCLGEEAKARALLLRMLASPAHRGTGLALLQPLSPPLSDTAEMRQRQATLERIRADPTVIKAANTVGRIRPAPVMRTLPPGFDPLQTGPVAKPTPGSI